MWADMGFHVLHRKLLHCAVAEVGFGVSSIVLWSIWACCATWFSAVECCCTFLCSKLDKHNQRRRRRRRARDIEASSTTSVAEDDDDEGSISNQAPEHLSKRRRRLSGIQRRDYREEHMRRALRPKSHHVHVGISEEPFHLNKRKSNKYRDHSVNPVDHIRVTRTSKFAHKMGSFKGSMHHRRR